MSNSVNLEFPEAWELLNAVEQRLEVLGTHERRQPDLRELSAAMARLMTVRDKVREAFRFQPAEAILDAQHDAVSAEMDELAEAEASRLPDVPLALVWGGIEQYQAEGR